MLAYPRRRWLSRTGNLERGPDPCSVVHHRESIAPIAELTLLFRKQPRAVSPESRTLGAMWARLIWMSPRRCGGGMHFTLHHGFSPPRSFAAMGGPTDHNALPFIPSTLPPGDFLYATTLNWRQLHFFRQQTSSCAPLLFGVLVVARYMAVLTCLADGLGQVW